MKKTIQTIILIGIAFLSARIYAQTDCGDRYPVLKEKTTLSDVIIEGTIIETNSSKLAESRLIYTSALIKVTKIFKGEIKDSIVELIYKGGRDSSGFQPDKGVSLRTKGTEGIFFLLKNNSLSLGRKGIPSYTHVCNTNAMIIYNHYGIYQGNGTEGDYSNLGKDLFPKLESIVNQKPIVFGLNSFEQEKISSLKKKIEVKAYQRS